MTNKSFLLIPEKNPTVSESQLNICMQLTVSLGKLGFLLASSSMWEDAGGLLVWDAVQVLWSQYL